MKKIVKHLLLILTPFAVLLVATNYYVDAGNIFNSGKYEQDISNVLLKQHNIEGVANYDERIVFKNLMSNIDTMQDVAVIGTSRTLPLNKTYFPNKSFRNLALSHSNINDIIAQIGIFDSLHKFPKELYIETTPFFTCKTLGDEWLSIAAFQHYTIKKLNIKNIETIEHPKWYFLKRKLDALTSISYFQSCIKNFRKKSNRRFKDIGQNAMHLYGRYGDGSINYSKEYATVDTIKLIANSKIFEQRENVESFDNNKLDALDKIIKLCNQRNVKVSLIMYPFVQDFYDAMNSKENNLKKMELQLIQFAVKHNVKLVGTFDPRKANLNRASFYDPLHCTIEAIENVFKLVQHEPISI
jgi:hypothetical protein